MKVLLGAVAALVAVAVCAVGPAAAAVASAVKPPAPSRPPTVALYARGTSYTAGAMSSPGLGYVNLLGHLHATQVYNAAVGGSDTPSLPYQYAADPVNRWTPGVSHGTVVIEAGIGESLSQTSEVAAAAERTFTSDLVTAVRWHMAGSVHAVGDSTITSRISPAPPATSTPIGVLAKEIDLQDAGDEVDISLSRSGLAPTDIDLLMGAWSTAQNGAKNGQYQVSVDGKPWVDASTSGIGDTRSEGEVPVTLATLRIEDVWPYSRIRIRKVGDAGAATFYGYLVQDNPNTPRVVLVEDVPLIQRGGQWRFPKGSAIQENPARSNATIETYRTLVRQVAASSEFRDRIVVANPEPAWNPQTDLFTDQIHPNNDGHEVYYQAVVSALAGPVAP